MRRTPIRFGFLLVPAFAACAGSESPTRVDDFGYNGTGIRFDMGALTYPEAADVCYSFSIVNGLDQLVVGRGLESTITSATRNPAYASWGANTPYVENAPFANGSPLVCSTQFGNGPGGDWSYVAPCDASADAADHTVTVWLDRFLAGTGPTQLIAGDDYQDPCPNGCAVNVACTENADTPVSFNFTIMRGANQGFFDVGVNFDDVFCSAKVDCAHAVDDPIELLFDPDGKRGQAAVLAMACSQGPDDIDGGDTVLLRDPIVINCDGVLTVLDPTAGLGNAWNEVNPDPAPGDAVWQYAVYADREQLSCDGAGATPGSCNKLSWNVAIGFDPSASDCRVTTSMTAGSQASLPGFDTPTFTTYPWLRVDVVLTREGGGLECSRHPLNGPPDGVWTDYTLLSAPESFCYSYDGTQFTNSGDCSADQPQGTVSGRLFADANGNGAQDVGEPGLAGVEVLITDSLNGTRTVTINFNGDYTATVPAGDTTVDVDETTLPAEATLTAGTDPTTVTVPAGGIVTVTEGGYQPQGTVGGRIFEDTNGNGTQEAGEPGLADIDVLITDSQGGTQTITTDANGDYSATVPAGDTLLDVDETTLPAGATQTAGTDPTIVTVPAGGSAGDVDGYQPAPPSDDCSPNPCQNGGTCVNDNDPNDGLYSCVCVNPYTGEDCAIDCSTRTGVYSTSGGILYVNTPAEVTYLESLAEISGDIIIGNDVDVTEIRILCIRVFSGLFKIQMSEHLTYFEMRQVPAYLNSPNISGSFEIEHNTVLETVNLAGMPTANGSSYIRDNCVLSTLLPAPSMTQDHGDNDTNNCLPPGECQMCTAGNGFCIQNSPGSACQGYEEHNGDVEPGENRACLSGYSPCLQAYCGDGICSPEANAEDDVNCPADCDVCSCGAGPCENLGNGTCYALNTNGLCPGSTTRCIPPPLAACTCSAPNNNGPCDALNGICYPEASPGVCPFYANNPCVP